MVLSQVITGSEALVSPGLGTTCFLTRNPGQTEGRAASRYLPSLGTSSTLASWLAQGAYRQKYLRINRQEGPLILCLRERRGETETEWDDD